MGRLFNKVFSGLIPTSRVDKNGRVVIRHMKPETGDSDGASIPPPASPSLGGKATVDGALLNDAVSVLLSNLKSTGNSLKSDDLLLRRKVEHYSGATLKKIAEMDNNPDLASKLNAFYHVFTELEVAGKEAYVRDVLETADFMAENSTYNDQSVFTLQRYRNLTPLNSDGSYPMERYRQVTRLMQVTHTVLESSSENLGESAFDYELISLNREQTPRLTDERLVDRILEASDSEYEKIIAIVRERSLINFDDITSLIVRDGPNGLSSGTL